MTTTPSSSKSSKNDWPKLLLALRQQARNYRDFGREESFTNDELIAEKYPSIRPTPGYPACPDHIEKQKRSKLIGAEERMGVSLTESFAMWPAASGS